MKSKMIFAILTFAVTLVPFTVHAQEPKGQILRFIGAANGVYTFQLGGTELKVKCHNAARYTGDGTNPDHIHPAPCVFNAPSGTTFTHGSDDLTKNQAGSVTFEIIKRDNGAVLVITRFGHLFLHLQIGEVVLPEYDITFRILPTR